MGDIFSQIQQGLINRGLSSDQALGITAGIYAEGGVTASGGFINNPTSGAMGLEQLLGIRKSNFISTYGTNPSLDNSLDYLVAELHGQTGTGNQGGAAVLSAGGPVATMTAYVKSFMRPGTGTTGDLTRGNQYLANNGALINKTIGDSIASFSPTLGAASNALGNALSAPGQALGAVTDKLFGGLDLSGWFQRIAIAILAILLIGIALSMLSAKPVAAIASKVPPLPA